LIAHPNGSRVSAWMSIIMRCQMAHPEAAAGAMAARLGAALGKV
jgi:hypothetical protein